MNKTSRLFTICFTLLVAVSSLWSCDKESTQDNPEGTGIFLIRNGTTTPLYYLKAENQNDTVFIDTFNVVPIEVYTKEESQATPAEFYGEFGIPLRLYKRNPDDSTQLVETFEQSPVITAGWIAQKNDELEFGVTQYSLYVTQAMIQ